MTPVAPPADLRALTSLRFIAAMWVVMFTFWKNLDVGFMPTLATKGYLGVELFFVLSGFILSHVYLEAAGTGGFRYRGFLWARLARVYPLHLFTLVGVGALAVVAGLAGIAVDGSLLSWESLPANLLLLHAWGFAPEAGWNHPSWSISAEWFAYLLFPAFAFVAWRLRARPVLATVAAGAGLVALYVVFAQLAGFLLTEATIRWGALRIVPCFALGCALYLIHRRGPVPAPGLMAGLAGLGVIVAASLPPGLIPLPALWDSLIVLLFAPLILGLAGLENARAGLMSSRAGVYLGEISYSVYMIAAPWQILAVNVAARLVGAEDKQLPLWLWLAVIAALPAAAAVSYHLVEHPARRWLRGLGAARSGPATAAGAT